MATLLLTAAASGATAGASAFAVGLATGAAAITGNFIDQKFLFPAAKPPSSTGNRIKELNRMTANEGEFIFFCAGPLCRVPGQLIWAGELQERTKVDVIRTGGGLKGSTAKDKRYFYFNSMAVAIAEGEINSISKIYANGKIIFDGNGGSAIGAGLSGFVDAFETLDNFFFKITGDYFAVKRNPIGFADRFNYQGVQKDTVSDPNRVKLFPGSSKGSKIEDGQNLPRLDRGGVILYNKIEGTVLSSRTTGLQDKSLLYQINVLGSSYISETFSIDEAAVSQFFIDRIGTRPVATPIRSEHTFFGIRIISSNSSVELKMNNNRNGKILSRKPRKGSRTGIYPKEISYNYEEIAGTYIVFDGDEDNPVYVPNVIKSNCRLKILIENNEVKCFINNTLVATNPWINGTVQKMGYFTDVPAVANIPVLSGSTGALDVMSAVFDNFILQVPIGSGQEIEEGLDDIRYNSITLYNGGFDQLPDSVIESEVVVQQSQAGILTRYFDDRNFSNEVGTKINNKFNFKWDKSKPIPEITSRFNFSADWTLIFVPTESSPNYQFRITCDDYFLFSITDNNGHEIFMKRTEDDHSFQDYHTFNNDGGAHNFGGDGPINSLSFTKGKKYRLKVQYANYEGSARILVQFRTSSSSNYQTLSKSEVIIANSDDCVFTPTFRGTAYCSIELLALYDFTNNLPQLSIFFEADSSLTVAELITKVLLRANLNEDDFSVDDIPDIVVNGFMVTSNVTTLDLINSIMTFANLSVQQDQSLIRFFVTGNERVHEIDADFLAARSGSGKGSEPALTITEIDNHGLPNEVVLTYYDIDRDLQPGSIQVRRLAVFTESVTKVDLPFALTRDEAQIIAERMLWSFWADLKSASGRLPEDFFFINQGDSIILTYKGFTHRIRITNITFGHNGVIDWNGIIQEIEVNDQSTTGNLGGGQAPRQTVFVPGELSTSIMNLPPIFGNQIDLPDAGYFFAGALFVNTAIWKGANILQSDDDSTFLSSNEIAIEAFAGLSLNILEDGPVSIVDEGNELDVELFNGTLESITQAQLFNEMNLAVIGNEIIAFRDVEELNPNQFRLTGLLRGLRDTVDHTSDHAIGERFVLLSADLAEFTIVSNATINQDRFWKGLSLGQLEADVTSFQENITGENLVPFRPVDIDGSRDGSDNLTITWNRQDRARFPLFVIQPPLSEQSLEFEVDILDGATVVRTITVTAETASYTAAEQTTDGLTPGDPVDVKIYQISAIVGRGNEGSETV